MPATPLPALLANALCEKNGCRFRRVRSDASAPTGARAGITDMDAANRYLKQVYLPNHNAEFALAASEVGGVFVTSIGMRLPNILCSQFERTVGNDYFV